MATEANLVTSQTAALDLIPLVIKDELLQIADKDTVFYDIADKAPLPEGEGRTLQFSRYERLPLPTSPLNEGETPIDTALVVSAVQAAVDQWGAVVGLSDVGLMTVHHPLLRVATDRLGTQFAELVDREIQKTLMGTTNVLFAGNKTSRANLIAGDNFTSDLIRQIVATLRSVGAPSYGGGVPIGKEGGSTRRFYAGCCDPFVAQDIQKDPLFSNFGAYQEGTVLMNAEFGMWLGCRWKESNLLPIISLLANVGNTGTNVAVPTAGVGLNAGETGFAANASVPVVVTLLDPVTGFETSIGAPPNVTTASAFAVQVTIQAAAPSGIYGVYVGLENAVVATLQQFVTHVSGTANVLTFIKAGAPNGANRFVTQATGAVAPTLPPATGTVHFTYVFGKNAYGVTELGKMKTTLTPAIASDSDPLIQRRKVGWKHLFKAIIKNTAFFFRIETLSAYG